MILAQGSFVRAVRLLPDLIYRFYQPRALLSRGFFLVSHDHGNPGRFLSSEGEDGT